MVPLPSPAPYLLFSTHVLLLSLVLLLFILFVFHYLSIFVILFLCAAETGAREAVVSWPPSRHKPRLMGLAQVVRSSMGPRTLPLPPHLRPTTWMLQCDPIHPEVIQKTRPPPECYKNRDPVWRLRPQRNCCIRGTNHRAYESQDVDSLGKSI